MKRSGSSHSAGQVKRPIREAQFSEGAAESVNPDECVAYPAPPAQPTLPPFNAGYTFAEVGQSTDSPSLTAHLDTFLRNKPVGESKVQSALRYLRELPAEIDSSQLLHAELSYICFADEHCPLIFDPAEDRWFVYDCYWKTSKSSMPRVRVHFQTTLLHMMRSVTQRAIDENYFPPPNDDEDHHRVKFLKACVKALSSREGAEKVVKEACMFFEQKAEFDTDPYLFQLQNAVVDLQTNQIRRGKPSDMCSRASPITIPDKWITNPGVVDASSAAQRQMAWDTIWSIFRREGPFHDLDHYHELGDQDLANFDFLHKVLARLLEGRPLCMCVIFTNPRGRNSKGLVEKMILSVWGDYHVPLRPTVFLPDKRGENEHSAAELDRRGARIAFANEILSDPWSNAVFKNKNSTDPRAGSDYFILLAMCYCMVSVPYTACLHLIFNFLFVV